MRGHKKRSIEEPWQSVELDGKGLEDFYSGGGLVIEELDDSEAQRYLGGAAIVEKLTSSKKIKKAKTADKPQKEKKVVADATEVVASPSHQETRVAKKATKTARTEEVKEVSEEQSTETLFDMSSWSCLSLHAKLMKSLSKLSFSSPTEVQLQTIPSASHFNKDVIVAAPTGCGKTLAFGLPICHKILCARDASEKNKFALIILPTRELAAQVKEHISAACPSVSIVVVVGGMSIEKQLRLLRKNPEIVVGTPGRLAGVLGVAKKSESEDPNDQICTEFRERLPHLSWLVLDEADRLVEEGHFKDLETLLALIYDVQREEKSACILSLQTFVFSATLATEDVGLAALNRLVKLQSDRLIVDLSVQGENKRILPAGLSFELLALGDPKERESWLLWRIFQFFFQPKETNKKIVIFVNAITYVYRLTSLLRTVALAEKDRHIRVVGVHSGVKQKDRLVRFDQFKAAERGIIVATDLAARGLDLSGIGLVIHMQPPREPDILIHRSGRTARAGRQGKVCLLVAPKEIPGWRKVFGKATGEAIEKVEKLLPINKDLQRAKDILKLAADVEGGRHRQDKERKENSWRAKMADECGLVLSEAEDDDDFEVLIDGKKVASKDEPEDDGFDGLTSYEKDKLVKAQAELNRFMLEPLPSAIKRGKYAI